MKFDGRLELDSLNKILAKRGLESRGRVQKYVDSEVLRYSDPLTPRSIHGGGLIRSGKTGTVIGSGNVIYNAPYARYQYYGKVMTDEQGRTFVEKHQKKPIVTNRNLTYTGAPERQSFWFEKVKRRHKKDILEGAAVHAGSRSG